MTPEFLGRFPPGDAPILSIQHDMRGFYATLRVARIVRISTVLVRGHVIGHPAVRYLVHDPGISRSGPGLYFHPGASGAILVLW